VNPFAVSNAVVREVAINLIQHRLAYLLLPADHPQEFMRLSLDSLAFLGDLLEVVDLPLEQFDV
jgi:hypothetical protein